MNFQMLKELEYISTAVGLPIEYTQGGGGNTSVKLTDELMAVKASGFKLKQITAEEGYVVVNYKNIADYYEHIDLDEDRDFEKESAEVVKNNIIPIGTKKPLRPSVEAGFHSILKKFVIHTHSVYANILCCTTNGQETVGEIFKDKDFACAWVPYINPGFCLTVRIKEEIDRCMGDSGKFPQVIFLENHGLIVTADNSEECVKLHALVNDDIKRNLSIKGGFPSIKLHKADDNICISKTSYLNKYFKSNDVTQSFFDEVVLYPDQLVYLNGNIGFDCMDKKLIINKRTGEMIYNANPAEAQAIEETLLAYIYVIENIRKKNLPLKVMSKKEIEFIKNWESEAYRKNLVKELGK